MWHFIKYGSTHENVEVSSDVSETKFHNARFEKMILKEGMNLQNEIFYTFKV
jgi:hypothetical protein